MLKRCKFVALDNTGRVDCAFEQRLLDLNAAIAFAMAIEDAAKVEIVDEGSIVARVVFG
jgi:hypothetical protein